MSDFHAFASAIRARFADMAKQQLFVVRHDYDAIWQAYLSAFPDGSNPVFRERTEHDCSCCRHFIRDIGAVVTIQNGALASIWDVNGLPEPYQTVADAMSAHVKGSTIADIFLTRQAQHGTAENHGMINGKVVAFNHFSVAVPPTFVSDDGDEKRGQARTTHAVLMRGLTELTPESVGVVADLIADNNLYRGQEHQKAVSEFQALQNRYLALPEGRERELLAWTMIDSPAARFRNTVIGTLVQDLVSGADVDAAVRMYEAKVAPHNYKRPRSIITKRQVDAAMKTIHELGLEPALERRHARLSDVSINSVLFVDNAVRDKMKDAGLKSLLMEEVAPAAFDPKHATEIAIDDFLTTVLPKVTALDLFLEPQHLGNFVSMTAPVQIQNLVPYQLGDPRIIDGSRTGIRTPACGFRVRRPTARRSWNGAPSTVSNLRPPAYKAGALPPEL